MHFLHTDTFFVFYCLGNMLNNKKKAPVSVIDVRRAHKVAVIPNDKLVGVPKYLADAKGKLKEISRTPYKGNARGINFAVMVNDKRNGKNKVIYHKA